MKKHRIEITGRTKDGEHTYNLDVEQSDGREIVVKQGGVKLLRTYVDVYVKFDEEGKLVCIQLQDSLKAIL